VATDIAARGIDIEELPHVVNYEIPNIPEDYVHRIGRTGRAGNSGEAVNLVCLDEEGFMMEIERFTKQEIPVQMLEGFGPEPDEKAEPIAMGRQTLWGGAGKPPSREVMAAAAKAARQEMMGRIRENKAKQGDRQPRSDRGEGQDGEGQQARGPRPSRHGNQPSRRHGEGQGQRQDRPQHARGPRPEGQGGQGNGGQRRDQNANRERRPRDGDELPRHIDPLKTTQFAKLDLPRRKPVKTGGQPDPTRTSIDSLAAGGKRHGGGGFGGGGNRGGGGGRFR
jgi:ATP-dependent RNA helicase RhlE